MDWKASGLNVIFDLGIYYAECLWTRRTKLEWLVLRGPTMANHFIKGLPGGKYFDPIQFMYGECRNIANAKRWQKKGLQHSNDPFILWDDSFFRRVLADAPLGRRSKHR